MINKMSCCRHGWRSDVIPQRESCTWQIWVARGFLCGWRADKVFGFQGWTFICALPCRIPLWELLEKSLWRYPKLGGHSPWPWLCPNQPPDYCVLKVCPAEYSTWFYQRKLCFETAGSWSFHAGHSWVLHQSVWSAKQAAYCLVWVF